MVQRHGTEAGQQTDVEKYKKISKYNTMEMDENLQINKDLKDIYENNIWKLNTKFLAYKEALQAYNSKGEIAWLNDIQYLTINQDELPNPENKITLDDMKNGAYAGLNVDDKNKNKTNKIETEKKYAGRVSFWIKQFGSLTQSDKAGHPLYWIIQNQQELMYKIIKYHNTQNNSLSTLNSDFKALVRITKLILGNKSELRFKFSALQMGLTDLENQKDDMNLLSSGQEEKQFLAYEVLREKCDELEESYEQKLSHNAGGISNKIFDAHQDLLSLALFVWDYPSRQEKYTLEFLEEGKENEALLGKNYVVIPNKPNNWDNVRGIPSELRKRKRCKFIFNEVKKLHAPIAYELKTPNNVLDGMNLRLSILLQRSYYEYKRRYVFIAKNSWTKYDVNDKQIKPTTVSNWVRDMYREKNLGIDGFRSSFVSYYLPKMNNSEKKLMATRMRTSVEILYRAYLKIDIYSPAMLPKVKIEPTEEVVRRGDLGRIEEDAIDADNIPMAALDINFDEGRMNNPTRILPALPIPRRGENNRKNFKKWYAKPANQTKHKDRVNEHSKKEKTYALRMVRELNNGLIEFENIKQTTLEKYGIKRTGREYITDKKFE